MKGIMNHALARQTQSAYLHRHPTAGERNPTSIYTPGGSWLAPRKQAGLYRKCEAPCLQQCVVWLSLRFFSRYNKKSTNRCLLFFPARTVAVSGYGSKHLLSAVLPCFSVFLKKPINQPNLRSLLLDGKTVQLYANICGTAVVGVLHPAFAANYPSNLEQ